jgi:two-component system, LytTR family, response regulator
MKKSMVDQTLEIVFKIAKRTGEGRLIIKSCGKIVFIPIDEIDWIEAAANYVRLIAGENTYAFRDSLSAIADKLDPSRFIRIHRSYIVNVSKITELQLRRDGFIVYLENGKRLPASKVYRSSLESLWNNSATASRRHRSPEKTCNSQNQSE